jgi:hypothetical protein
MTPQEFLRGRQRYWQELVRRDNPAVEISDAVPETKFVVNGAVLGFEAWFEDDGETGYLYVSDTSKNRIVRHLHLYDGSPSLDLKPQDVKIKWDLGRTKCGVEIFAKMRGIIVLGGREGRVWMSDRQSPGISDPAWLSGF